MYFGTSPGITQIEITRAGEGNSPVPGVQLTVTKHQIADTKPAIRQYTRPANLQLHIGYQKTPETGAGGFLLFVDPRLAETRSGVV